MEFRLSVLLCVCLLLALVCQAAAGKGRCPRKQTCDKCIQAGPECAWCNQLDIIAGPRCNTQDKLVLAGCSRPDIYSPKGGLLSIRNESRMQESLPIPATVVQLTLRPGVVQSVMLNLPKDQQTPRDVTLDTSPVPEHVNITFNRTESPWLIQVNVDATRCPRENGPWSVTVTPNGFALILVLQITLECACECTKHPEDDSPACGARGALECGRCVCRAPYTGGRCQRIGWSPVPALGDERCRGGPDNLVCSGRGTCEDGFCNCDARSDPAQRYTGHFCECSDFDCPYSNNRMCGGQGRCFCGRCACDRGWTHEACDCSMDSAPCMGAHQKICSDRGMCRCGECVCESPYAGVTCEHSPYGA